MCSVATRGKARRTFLPSVRSASNGPSDLVLRWDSLCHYTRQRSGTANTLRNRDRGVYVDGESEGDGLKGCLAAVFLSWRQLNTTNHTTAGPAYKASHLQDGQGCEYAMNRQAATHHDGLDSSSFLIDGGKYALL